MRSFFTTHAFLKALSLGLAFCLWWIVHGEQSSEISFSAKIQIKGVPENLVVAGDVDPEVRVRVSGPRARLKRIQEKRMDPIEIDMSDAKMGVNARSLYGEDFNLPRGTRITNIVPEVIRITLDHAEERLIRIEPRFVGSLDDGYELINHESSPPYVKVRAARSELEGLTALRTEPISLNDRHENFEGTYALRGYRPQWGLDDRKIDVKVQIREKEVSRILDVPVLVGGVSKPVKVEPQTVALRIKGPAGRVYSFLNEKPEISVDGKALHLEQRKNASFRIKPAVPKRPGIEITMIPDKVRVTIQD